MVAYDETGDLQVVLEDREVRTLVGKRAQQIYDEVVSL